MGLWLLQTPTNRRPLTKANHRRRQRRLTRNCASAIAKHSFASAPADRQQRPVTEPTGRTPRRATTRSSAPFGVAPAAKPPSVQFKAQVTATLTVTSCEPAWIGTDAPAGAASEAIG